MPTPKRKPRRTKKKTAKKHKKRPMTKAALERILKASKRRGLRWRGSSEK